VTAVGQLDALWSGYPLETRVNNGLRVAYPVGRFAQETGESRVRNEELPMIILIIILILLFGGGGGYYGHTRWGPGGGAGVGLGTILVILLIAYLLGLFR
jgi:hypothetical protein